MARGRGGGGEGEGRGRGGGGEGSILPLAGTIISTTSTPRVFPFCVLIEVG